MIGGRATGLWKLQVDRLVLLGFRGVAEMPGEVKREFAAATGEVSLDQTGLGIVRAALTGEPAIAEFNGSELDASASWLARFATRRSLAVPIEREGTIVGVIAVSTTEPLDRTGRTWTALTTIAAELARSL